ncbi:GTPase Era [Thiohalobacter sp. IOR34]|uniref:GTPase Era n=1 Tax=Thiohalobacter sp. IOR34 TaxID=3057176 RepID=UPI0025B25822|nr:GTPase Era [Thiohalobacter sp. IOR34]WJW76142.1 GTPase Era [Thiohalobacter sp. IOR34]
MSSDGTTDFHCGYVALVGRPNVGKSTLLNRILGQKISITSRKPQTTRHRILGIKTGDDWQVVYVDTPGLHRKAKRALNRALNRAASDALFDVDLVVFLVEAGAWTEEDEMVLAKLRRLEVPVILAVNKVDRLRDKTRLLPYLQEVSQRYPFAAVVPLSAARGDNVDALEDEVRQRLPQSGPFFPEDQLTDRSERFLAAELVREKLFRKLGQELPYGLTVAIEQFREEGELLRIHALIWVERPSHKSIVIGRQGRLLKEVGREARLDMQRLFGRKVFLELWVKVKEGWADDERALRSLGIEE